MCNDRDPPWFNDKIRLATAYKYIRQNGSDAYWQHRLKVLQDRLNNSIESSKKNTIIEWLVSWKIRKKTLKLLLVFTENNFKQ